MNNNKAVSDNNIYSLLKVVEQSKAISKNVTHKVKNKIPLLSVEQAVLDHRQIGKNVTHKVKN